MSRRGPRTGIQKPMDKEQDSKRKKISVAAPTDPVPTDAEIEAAAERLGPGWLQGAPRPRAAGASLVVQSLARGRSHAVTVELKRPARRLPRSR